MGSVQVVHDADGSLRVALHLSADELSAASQAGGTMAAPFTFDAPSTGAAEPSAPGSAPDATATGASTAEQTTTEPPAAAPPPTPFGTPPAPEDATAPDRPAPDPTDLTGRGPQPDAG